MFILGEDIELGESLEQQESGGPVEVLSESPACGWHSMSMPKMTLTSTKK